MPRSRTARKPTQSPGRRKFVQTPVVMCSIGPTGCVDVCIKSGTAKPSGGIAGMLGDVRPSETNPFKHHPSSGRATRHSPRNLAEIPMPVTTSYQGIQVLSARMLLLHLTGRCSAERQREHRSLQQSSTGNSATGQAAPSLGDVKEDALVPAPISPGDRAGSFPKELVRQSCLMAAPFGVERP